MHYHLVRQDARVLTHLWTHWVLEGRLRREKRGAAEPQEKDTILCLVCSLPMQKLTEKAVALVKIRVEANYSTDT